MLASLVSNIPLFLFSNIHIRHPPSFDVDVPAARRHPHPAGAGAARPGWRPLPRCPLPPTSGATLRNQSMRDSLNEISDPFEPSVLTDLKLCTALLSAGPLPTFLFTERTCLLLSHPTSHSTHDH